MTKGKKLTSCMLALFSIVIGLCSMCTLMLKEQNISISQNLSVAQQMSSVVDTEDDSNSPPFDENAVKIPSNAKIFGDITLPEGWEWVHPERKLQKGSQTAEVNYIGEDKDDYAEAKRTRTITINITSKSNATNPWKIVIYIMIPWNGVMTIVYIIHMRKMRFRKKFIEQQEEPPVEDVEEKSTKKSSKKAMTQVVEETEEPKKPKKTKKTTEE